MKCQFCGNELADGQVFCGYCGHRVAAETKRVCPSCGHEAAAGELFCSRCGTRLSGGGSKPPIPSEHMQIRVLINNQQQAVIEIPADAAALKAIELAGEDENIRRMLDGKRIISQTYDPGQYVNFDVEDVQRPSDGANQLMLDLSIMSYYEGEPTLGFAKATGILKVYGNRLEMKKTYGSSAASMGGLVGLGISAAKAKKDPYIYWFFKDIKSVREGRYGVGYRTIVITMRDGRTYSFASSSPAPNKIRNAVETINGLLRAYR